MSDYKLSVSIDGDASGMKKAFQVANAAVADFDAKTSGITSRMGSLGKGVTSLGQSINKHISKPAIAATSALAGITLVKGFNRLAGIDDARAKLLGLGHDAKSVDKIMSSALASVKGTSFGMDEAATTAAGACAAGIKQGKELTRYLSLTADAAAIAGTSMSDMGAIINKVQTSNRAYTENLNQLADRGLPIYQWLADECHTTQDAVRDMASSGAISSKMFLSAIEKNIGGAAKTIGDNSFKASINNLNAALSRIGANFLDAGSTGGGVFSQLKPLIKDVTGLLDVVEKQAADWGVALGKSFSPIAEKAQSLISKFEGLSSAQQLNIVKSAGLGTALVAGLGPATEKVGKFITAASKISEVGDKIGKSMTTSFTNIPKSLMSVKNGLTGVAGDINKVVTGIAKPAGTAFGKMATTTASACTRIGGLIKSEMSNAAGNVAFAFTSKYPELATKIALYETKINNTFSKISTNVSGIVSKVSTKVSGVVSKVGPVVSGAFSKLAPVMKKFGSTCGTMVQQVGSGMTSLITKSAGFGNTLIKSFMKLTGIGAIVGVAVAGLGLLEKGFGTQINAMLKNVTEKGPAIVEKLSSSIISNLPTLMADGAMLIRQIVDAITQFAPQLMLCGANILNSLSAGISLELPSIITSILNMLQSFAGEFAMIMSVYFPTFIQNMGDFFSSVLDRIGTDAPKIIETLCNGIVAAIPTLISSAIGIINSLLGAINSCAPAIITGGADIIVALVQGLADNLPTLIPTAISLISTIATKLIENLPKIITAGLNLIVALATGLVKALPQLIKKVPQIIQSLVTAIVKLLPVIIQTGITLITTLAVGLIQAIPDLVAAIPDIIKAVKDSFAEVDWGEVGKNILNGIAKGLSSVASNLIDAAKKAGSEALASIKKTLGIHSPSRVFRDEVGQMMGLGLGIGFEKSIPVKSMRKSVSQAVADVSAVSLSLTSGADMSRMVTPVQSSVQNTAMNYAITTAAGTKSAEPVYVNVFNDDVITMMSSQNAKLVNAMLEGMSNMKIVADNREVTRYMSNLGFQKAGV